MLMLASLLGGACSEIFLILTILLVCVNKFLEDSQLYIECFQLPSMLDHIHILTFNSWAGFLAFRAYGLN